MTDPTAARLAGIRADLASGLPSPDPLGADRRFLLGKVDRLTGALAELDVPRKEEEMMACSNSNCCPLVLRLDDGRFLVVGEQITDAAARELGGNPDASEGAVLVPGELVDAVSAPLRDRIAELEARLGELIGSREAIAAVSFERLQRIKAFEAEREWRAAQTDRGGPDLIWAIGGADGYIMVNVSEEAARRKAEKWPNRVALWAERTAWRDAAIEEPKQ